MKFEKIALFLFIFFCCSKTILAQTIKDSSKIIRVLSYNIYHGETVAAPTAFDLDLLAKVINDVQPDLVALQEVDFKTKRARNLDLTTELGLRTKLAPIFGKAMDFSGGAYGEGILSKYTFFTTKNHPLKAQMGKEPRAALEVQIQLKNGSLIRFVGTHLDHTKEETDRINQAKQLNELFGKDDIPTILAGDLNAEPNSKTMRFLFDHWTPSSIDNQPTYPAKDPTKKIDYILFRPAKKWRLLEYRVIEEEVASDHRPILSVLELLED
jgi:endonuclease/exonuclease/phosphatase family metal-dependent hydrolase